MRISRNELPKHGLSEILKGNDDFFPLGRHINNVVLPFPPLPFKKPIS